MKFPLLAAALTVATPAASATFFFDDFESGALSSDYTIAVQEGRVQVTDNGLTGQGRGLQMDTAIAATTVFNRVELTFDATGRTGDILFRFDVYDHGDEANFLPITFTDPDLARGDGVALSGDGVTYHTLVPPNAFVSGTLNGFTFNLTDFASTNGFVLGADTRLSFSQIDNFPVNTDGLTFDNIELAAGAFSPPMSAVPLPAGVLLLGGGLTLLGAVRRRSPKA